MHIYKALFLDIDGVIAVDYGLTRPRSEWIFETAYPFDPLCVARLNVILTQSQAEIVLTSQWRIDYTMEEIAEIFKQNGVVQAPLAHTEDFGGFARCAEIETFLQNHTVNQFIIFDDIELDCFPQHFIHIMPNTGITEAIVRQAVKLLA